MDSVVEQEKLIQKYIDEDNREAAVKLLFKLVKACARAKDFRSAEALRERIFEVDSLALPEIIRSGEIIEQEKNQSIDKTHKEIWAELYQKLTVEEANALYFALDTVSCSQDQMVYTQGEHRPRLYFVNSGRLKVYYLKHGREVLLKVLGRGQIAGEDTFFCNSVCTTSMIALGTAEISYLDSKVLQQWKTEFPVLESKLGDFASKFKKITDLIQERELDRRSMKRVNVAGLGEAYLLDAAGVPIGKPFKVEVADVSRGGIAFYVRITKRETASLLLGQKINVKYLHPLVNASKAIDRSGTVVAVRFHPLEDCSVSVKFDSPIDEKLIDEFGRLAHQVMNSEYRS